MPRLHRSALSSPLLLIAAGFALLGATRCGGAAVVTAGAAGSSSGGDVGKAGAPGGTGGSAGGTGGSAGAINTGAGEAGVGGSKPTECPGPLSKPNGRPSAKTCAVTPLDPLENSTGVCTLDSDCADGGPDEICLNGKCGLDDCLADKDCPAGQACRCANEVGGNTFPGNRCIPAGCRVDADCGKGAVCSPDYTGRCGGISGFECHSAADTCNTNADCCDGMSQCGYQPLLGHWACAEVMVCDG